MQHEETRARALECIRIGEGTIHCKALHFEGLCVRNCFFLLAKEGLFFTIGTYYTGGSDLDRPWCVS